MWCGNSSLLLDNVSDPGFSASRRQPHKWLWSSLFGMPSLDLSLPSPCPPHIFHHSFYWLFVTGLHSALSCNLAPIVYRDKKRETRCQEGWVLQCITRTCRNSKSIHSTKKIITCINCTVYPNCIVLASDNKCPMIDLLNMVYMWKWFNMYREQNKRKYTHVKKGTMQLTEFN